MPTALRIQILAADLPGLTCGPSPDRPGGHRNIHVGVQRRGKAEELLDLQPGDAPSATWTLECRIAPDARDITGPYIQGRPGARFIYLSWVTADADAVRMFRRAKLVLADIDPPILRAAVESGHLTARLGLTDHRGNPRCASVRPPTIEWSAN